MEEKGGKNGSLCWLERMQRWREQYQRGTGVAKEGVPDVLETPQETEGTVEEEK